MSFLKKTSFASGEIDPSLQDNTDIKAYYSGLKTARNVTISKTGRILNDSGSWFYSQTQDGTSDVVIYLPDNQNFFLEFGVGYARVNPLSRLSDQKYVRPSITTTLSDIVATSYTLDDISKLKFATIKHSDGRYWTYVACKGKILEAFYASCTDGVYPAVTTYIERMTTGGGFFGVLAQDYPQVLPYPSLTPVIEYQETSANMNARTGHSVLYGVTFVTKDGLESPIFPINSYKSSNNVTTTSVKLPTGIQTTAFFIKNITLNVAKYGTNIKQINVYRRPIYIAGSGTGDGFAWGLIGQSVNNLVTDLTNQNLTFGFTDFGQAADYVNGPPELHENYTEVLDAPSAGLFFNVSGVASYSNRLLLFDDNYLFASRINQPTYFLKEYPATAASSFSIQVGNTGEIYYLLDHNGLTAFTSEGVYYGGYDVPISDENPFLPKRGKLIIDENVKPILTPYGVFFVDRSTNSIKTLEYDDVAKSMMDSDVSLFNDHLFYLKRVKNWVFIEGANPHLEVVMNDGTLLHLTYNKVEKIMAWTRHDTEGSYKNVVGYYDKKTGDYSAVYLTDRTVAKSFEISSKRIKKDVNTLRAFSHCSSYYKLVEPFFPNGMTITLALGPSTSWDDNLTWFHDAINAPIGPYFTSRIGKTFVVESVDRKEKVYLKLLSATAGVTAIFQPDRLVPEQFRSSVVPVFINVFECHDQITGLNHLEGLQVSVVSDGAVLSSPNNDHPEVEPAQILTVQAGGILNLPYPVQETIVGLPYTSDIETLQIDSKDGSNLINKKLINELHINYTRTRSCFVSGIFPENNKVKGMEYSDIWNRFDEINQPLVEKTIRKTYRIYSDYELNGRVAIRQVDPLPVEVVSIISDVVGG